MSQGSLAGRAAQAWLDTAASIFKMIYKDAQTEGARSGYKIDLDEK
jgi:hypothetical protein